MRLVLAAILMLGLLASAHSQGAGMVGRGMKEHRKDEPKRKAEDKNTKSALEQLPDKKFDPWGGMRETPATTGTAASPRAR